MVEQGCWIWIGVVQDDSVANPDVLEGPPIVVAEGVIYGIQHLKPLTHLQESEIESSHLTPTHRGMDV